MSHSSVPNIRPNRWNPEGDKRKRSQDARAWVTVKEMNFDQLRLPRIDDGACVDPVEARGVVVIPC